MHAHISTVPVWKLVTATDRAFHNLENWDFNSRKMKDGT